MKNNHGIRGWKHVVTFAACAGLSFALLAPGEASASSRNIAGPGCASIKSTSNNTASFYCSMPTDDTKYTIAALSGAYFDFQCASGFNASYNLNKLTLTGSFFQDTGNFLCTNNQGQDKFLNAVNVKTNASVDDYLWATAFSVFTLWGVQAHFS